MDTQHNMLMTAGDSDVATLLQSLGSRETGLLPHEVVAQRSRHGANIIATEHTLTLWERVLDTFKNPLNLLLVLLAVVSYSTGDYRAAIIIAGMMVLAVVLRFTQEIRADVAAAKLKALVARRTAVLRDGHESTLPFEELVVGDIVNLSAGAMIPADVRLIAAKNLSLDQSTLTGEALPVNKYARATHTAQTPLEHDTLCFLGSSVVSGAGQAVVIATGARTFFGDLAQRVTAKREESSFDRGVNSFTWLMIRFIAVMVPLVFLINGVVTRNWWEAFLFATSIAVGLTPEMFPMIVSVNLAKGALTMSHKRVIVKRLNAIQNIGAMDVLCTDKTGTLTEGKIALDNHVDMRGAQSMPVLHYAYLNSFFHTGLNNVLDDAIIAHTRNEQYDTAVADYHKVDEIPFDFVRRRMSVIVEHNGTRLLICKGAYEEILTCCRFVAKDDTYIPLDDTATAAATALVHAANQRGFRELAVAYKQLPSDHGPVTVADESDLVLCGLLSFLDPPKESAKAAVQALGDLAITIKILTGDSDMITTYICDKVGIPTSHVVRGQDIAQMDDATLATVVEQSHVFAKLSPDQKERILRTLQRNGHVVGFMGDGINDAPALRSADVGISVNSAVDIAKESSDIILLDATLDVLKAGVVEGRKVFGNIIKYVRMAASSNFGNMFSIVVVSAFLPFVPMLPIQILLNNLLYDLSQSAIPTDSVDPEWILKPRRWDIDTLLRFILAIGPISSIFDYITFALLLFMFDAGHHPEFFHTAWFIESIFSQILVIHVIRTTKIPFLQSMASWQLSVASLGVLAGAAWLTISPLASTLGFVALPGSYWLVLAGLLVTYIPLTQLVKAWYVRRYGI